MKKDIQDRIDIEILVNTFYDRVKDNHLLGRVFDDVMKVDWNKHLPKMYDFWENIVFQTGNYKGRPFLPHLEVNAKETLTSNHFDQWLQLFNKTIDDLYEGPIANELKIKSQNIKEVWNYKMTYINSFNADKF
jgi:hemoglobin